MVILSDQSSLNDEYDFIVVGSGAGGGPVAANLASGGNDLTWTEAGARQLRYRIERGKLGGG
jgi:choline dehydrogenase